MNIPYCQIGSDGGMSMKMGNKTESDSDTILLETGDFILLETGDKILNEVQT